MSWRTELIYVEKCSDELWVGVKGQSNQEIARTPRNVFRNSVEVKSIRGRATNRTRGSQILPNPDELRMLIDILRSEGKGAKVLIREGKNPDLQLRSQSVY
jgi:hypothetical protein